MRYILWFVLAVLAVALGVLLAPHLGAIVVWSVAGIAGVVVIAVAFGIFDAFLAMIQRLRGD